MKRRILILLVAFLFGVSPFILVTQDALAAIDCTTYAPNDFDGRCLYQTYFAGFDFQADINNGGYGGNGIWADAGTPNAGKVCPKAQDTDADITGSNQCGLWNYTDSLGSDGLNSWAFPDTIEKGNPNSAQNFVNFIHDYLFYNQFLCSINNFQPPSKSYKTYDVRCQYYMARILGAAFIVLTMYGPPYTTYNVGPNVFNNQRGSGGSVPIDNAQAGILDARNVFDNWKQRVLQLDASAPGAIEWNALTPPSVATVNHLNSSASDYNHDVLVRIANPQVNHVIIFHMPGGKTYIINRRCGNSDAFAVLPPVNSPLPPTCDIMSLSVPYLDPSKTFSISASISYLGATGTSDAAAALAAGDKIGISVSGPGFSYPLTKFTPSISGNRLTATTPTLGPVGAGNYTVTHNLYNSSGNTLVSPTCTNSFNVANMPYFQVNGGDVSAGGGMSVN
ncbi:MAG TPA: hypothetical protein VLG47_06360 [Candidatus Saccharimonadales bacterium]|nr:hypothetical protein [Candidatus Saccharimonadales bacterium]